MIRKALVEMTGGLYGAHTMPVMAIAGALEKWQSVSVCVSPGLSPSSSTRRSGTILKSATCTKLYVFVETSKRLCF